MSDPALSPHRVAVCSMQVDEAGDGFAMDLTDEGGEVMRLAFPRWVIHQLMRTLPHLDAAVQAGSSPPAGSAVAYPAIDWRVEPAAGTDGIALHLRNDRRIDAAFQLDAAAAVALHRELGLCIAGIGHARRQAPDASDDAAMQRRSRDD